MVRPEYNLKSVKCIRTMCVKIWNKSSFKMFKHMARSINFKDMGHLIIDFNSCYNIHVFFPVQINSKKNILEKPKRLM